MGKAERGKINASKSFLLACFYAWFRVGWTPGPKGRIFNFRRNRNDSVKNTSLWKSFPFYSHYWEVKVRFTFSNPRHSSFLKNLGFLVSNLCKLGIPHKSFVPALSYNQSAKFYQEPMVGYHIGVGTSYNPLCQVFWTPSDGWLDNVREYLPLLNPIMLQQVK